MCWLSLKCGAGWQEINSLKQESNPGPLDKETTVRATRTPTRPTCDEMKIFLKKKFRAWQQKNDFAKKFHSQISPDFFFIWIFLLLSNEEKKLIETESSFKLNVFYPWRTFSMKSQLEENQVKLQLSLTKCECISWPHFCKGCSCLANRIIEIKSLEVFLERRIPFQGIIRCFKLCFTQWWLVLRSKPSSGVVW